MSFSAAVLKPIRHPTFTYKYFFFEYQNNSYWITNADSFSEVETIVPSSLPFFQQNSRRYNLAGYAIGETLVYFSSLSYKPLVSLDGGDNWFQSTWPEGTGFTYTHCVYAGGKYLVVRSGKVLCKTTDFINWSTSTAFGANIAGFANIGDTVVGAPVGTREVYTSVNGGDTWTTIALSGASAVTKLLATDGVAFVLLPVDAFSIDKEYRSVDGTNWVVTTGLPALGSDIVRAHSCAGGGVWLVFYGNTYLYSTDSGVVWTAYTLPSSHVAQCSHYADGNFLVGTATNKMLASTDGVSWAEYTTLSGFTSGFSAIISAEIPA